jgi:hypothetical protein
MSHNLSAKTEKTQNSVIINGVSIEIRTGYLPNTSKSLRLHQYVLYYNKTKLDTLQTSYTARQNCASAEKPGHNNGAVSSSVKEKQADV